MGDRLAAWAGECAIRLFGPVFALEAARTGRRLSTFVVRWLYLLILVGVLGMFFYSSRHKLDTSDGTVDPNVLTRFCENFFWVYTITQFLAVSALVPAMTAGAITVEKERKTLSFLLATTLSAKEIVFGKLSVRIGELIMLVLAGMPVLSLLQFLGGIEPRLVLLATGMTLATVVSLSAIGAAASVEMARTRDAVILAYAIPVGYVALSAYCLSLKDAPGWSGTVDIFAFGNPFRVAGQLGGSSKPDQMLATASWYIGFHGLVSAIAFAFAVVRLRRSSEPSGARGSKRRGRARARKHPPVGDDPVVWREMYVEPGSGGGLIRRLFLFAILAAILLPLAAIIWKTMLTTNPSFEYFGADRYSPLKDFQGRANTWVSASTCGLGMLMLLRAAVRGASAVAGERDRDTWLSLIGTPLTTVEILRGKWMGCVWGQRDLLYLLTGVWGIGVVTGSVNLFILAPVAASLVVYLNAFAWLGIRSSITARNSRAAIARAVPQALFLGGGYWLVIGCCMMGCAFSSARGDGLMYFSAFVVGATPPCVLGMGPLVNFELLSRIGSEESRIAVSLTSGWGVGMIAWLLLANVFSDNARRNFAAQANSPLTTLSWLPNSEGIGVRPDK